ncbi:SH3 domain-containing protein Dlish [Aplysia californica]|uniref:SH3 domain-containing protein Dlish n=1 Tax=Aplysia californica TaxID=6500 RepID=A0ABM1VT73_APLCA|nr:SH3 domain-containing protein Dlish [Aplysia californica]
MAFLCPSRRGRQKKKRNKEPKTLYMGRITGSASIDTLVRVGLEKQHGLSPDSRMLVIQDFLGTGDGELSAQTGDSVYLLYRENDWVYVITELGQEGFLPFICVTPSNDVTGPTNKSRHQKGRSLDRRDGGVSDDSLQGEEGSDSSLSRGHHPGTPSVFPSNLSNPLPKPARTLNVPDVVSTNNYVQHPPVSDINRGKKSPKRQSLSADPHRKASRKSANSDSVTEVKTFIKEPCGKFLVVFQFRVVDENDVNVDRGEVVTALNREDPLWTWVRRLNGQEGFMPSAFLCRFPEDLQTNKGDPNTNSSNNQEAAPKPTTKFHDVRELITLRNFTAQSADDISVAGGDHVFADLANQIEKDWIWVYAPATGNYGYIPKDNVKWPTDYPKFDDVKSNLSRPP